MKIIKIALAVTNCPLGQTRTNIQHMESMVSKAARSGASIICFPELNISGYSTKNEIRKFAEPFPGETSCKVAEMSKKEKIVILAGMVEKKDEEIFPCHIVAYPDQDLQIYRKLYLAPPERPLFKADDKIPVFNACGIRFGIQLCYDAHFPELSTFMAEAGADIVFMPHASPRGTSMEKFDSWMRHLTARAYDNAIFVAACNQTGNNGAGLDFPGMAVVISPSGKPIALDTSGEETLLCVELDLGLIAGVRQHPMRYFLPNRRHDLFPLKPAGR